MARTHHRILHAGASHLSASQLLACSIPRAPNLTRMYSRMHAPTTHFSSCTRMLLSPARLFTRARVRRRRTAVCSSCARMLLQPAHGALAMVALFRAKNGFCMHACTLRRRIAVPALACSSALRNYQLACTRTRAPPPHCSSCARMLLPLVISMGGQPPMLVVYLRLECQ